MIRGTPIIQSKSGPVVWNTPIPYDAVAFCGAGLFPESGELYHDAGPRKQHGTLTNMDIPATSTSGWGYSPELRRPYAALDGSNDRIAIPATLVFAPVTFAAWIRFSGSARCIFSNRPSAGYAFELATKIQVIAGSTFQANTTLTEGVLYHVAATIDAAGNVAHYLNGLPDGTGSGATVTAPATNMSIGSRYATVSQYPWSGLIADPMMFAAVLSQSQISWLANPAHRLWEPWRRRWACGVGTTGGGTTYNETGSGAIALSGASAASLAFSAVPSGGIVLSGISALSVTFSESVSGGVVFAGTAPASIASTVVSSGGVTLSGIASASLASTVLASGGIALSGSAAPSLVMSIVASGEITLGGVGTQYVCYSEESSGGLSLSGLASVVYTTDTIPGSVSGSVHTRSAIGGRLRILPAVSGELSAIPAVAGRLRIR